MNSNGEDVNCKSLAFLQLVGRKKSLRESDSRFSFPFRSQLLGGVCVEAWTDSPATPLPKQLTAITFPSCQQKLLNGGSWDKTKEDDTWVFPPHILILGKIMPHSI